jgi:hypothetical protein
LEHFVRLKRLYVSYNQLTELPALPSSLTDLYCDFNQFTSLPALPPGLTYLSCKNNQLTSLPALPSGLRHLRCEGNKLTSLPALPNSLWYIYCGGNKLTSLPDLPNNAFFMDLDCSDNNLTSLPALPKSLSYFDCSLNQLTSIDVTGLKLQEFYCNHNYLPGKSAVTGFNGAWDGAKFIFDPQKDTPAHTYTSQVTTQPTCTTAGVTTYTCVDGDHAYTQAKPPALGHDFSVKQNTVDPTYDAQGYTVYQCSRCAATENRDFTARLTPPRGIFGTQPMWTGEWWHYILFFIGFGWIWMW